MVNVLEEKNEVALERREQRYEVITRNYSRKEGYEMFSLTTSRQLEVESSFYRRRAEMYLALYDVEIQVLEEMLSLGYATKEFLSQRKNVLIRQLKALKTKMIEENESGKLTDFQIHLNELTFVEIELRK